MPEAFSGLMTAPFGAVTTVLAGAALGLVFYAGLWWTVRHAAAFRRPGLSVLASMVMRMTVTLAGFYLVADREWLRLLPCLLGFVLARVVVTWLTRPPASMPTRLRGVPGTRHAP